MGDRYQIKSGVIVDTKGKARYLPLPETDVDQLAALAADLNANDARAGHFVWQDGSPPKA